MSAFKPRVNKCARKLGGRSGFPSGHRYVPDRTLARPLSFRVRLPIFCTCFHTLDNAGKRTVTELMTVSEGAKPRRTELSPAEAAIFRIIGTALTRDSRHVTAAQFQHKVLLHVDAQWLACKPCGKSQISWLHFGVPKDTKIL